jgi:hypothetical protein
MGNSNPWDSMGLEAIILILSNSRELGGGIMADIIKVQGTQISLVLRNQKDYISLTDIAKHRNPETPADIV